MGENRKQSHRKDRIILRDSKICRYILTYLLGYLDDDPLDPGEDITGMHMFLVI